MKYLTLMLLTFTMQAAIPAAAFNSSENLQQNLDLNYIGSDALSITQEAYEKLRIEALVF